MVRKDLSQQAVICEDGESCCYMMAIDWGGGMIKGEGRREAHRIGIKSQYSLRNIVHTFVCPKH